MSGRATHAGAERALADLRARVARLEHEAGGRRSPGPPGGGPAAEALAPYPILRALLVELVQLGREGAAWGE